VKARLIVLGSTILLLLVIFVGVEIVTSGGSHDSRHTLEAAELAWIARYYKWEDDPAERTCEAAATRGPTAGRLPVVPTEFLRPVSRLARAACRGEISWARADRAVHAKLFLSRRLPRARGVLADSHIDPKLGRVASKLAERKVQTRCWSTNDWYHINLERQAITQRTDFWAQGQAERAGVIHLDNEFCQSLARFYAGELPSSNLGRSVLATSLLILAHEAEHEYNFSFSEAVVECYAVQDVRDLVTEAGRTDRYAADIAAYAWELSYLHNDPDYSTSRCRNGGPLDIYPKSKLWP
jgi:hypothetical protein